MNNMNELIENMGFGDKITNKMHNVGINSLKELWVLTRKNLKELNFTDKEICLIKIKLQLRCLDLDKKTYVS